MGGSFETLQFDSFFVENGVLRAKARLKYAPFPFIDRYSFILDNKDHFTDLFLWVFKTRTTET